MTERTSQAVQIEVSNFAQMMGSADDDHVRQLRRSVLTLLVVFQQS